MSKVRVPLYGTVGKSVRVNPDASFGAQLGVDFFDEAGRILTLASLSDRVLSQLGLSSKNNVIFEEQIVDGTILARVGDDETVTGAWDFSGGIDLTTGAALRIYDATNADNVTVSHDGADLNIVGTNTVNINITGITSLQAGSVDADFDAITATSYGGVLEASLVDRTAANEFTFIQASPGQYPIKLISGNPKLAIEQSAAAADTKVWDMGAEATRFAFRTRTDAYGGGVVWLAVNRTGTAIDNATFATDVIVGSGNDLVIRDATNTDSVTANHDGTDLTLTGVNTANFDLDGFTGFVQLLDELQLAIYSAANANGTIFSQVGSVFDITGVVSTDFELNNFTGNFVLRDGMGFRHYDATDTDYAEFLNNGTDYITAFTNIADWQLQGLSQFELRSGCDLRIYGPDNSNSGFIAHTNSNFQIVSGGSSNIQMVAGSGLINLVTGQTLRIFDSGNTDRLEMSHDSTDFNMVGVNSTDLNITGFTAVQSDGTLRILEGAAAAADAAGYGQLWVLNTAPNRPKFTDDAGNDWDLDISNTKYKTANESVTSSTTFQNDDHLASFNLLADTWYKVEGYMVITSTSAGDFKAQWTFTNAPQSSAWTVSGSDSGAVRSSDHGNMNANTFLAINGTTAHGFHVTGYVRTNATTGGTTTLQWAQNSSNATPAVLYAGSWMTFTKLS